MQMATGQSLEVQDKKELVAKGEQTASVRFYVPATDIYETDDALTVVREVPGV
jgi:HSP20 family protein